MHTDSHPWERITADIRDVVCTKFDGIDYIVHLAAQISVPESIDNPDVTLSINVDGTKSIISAAEIAGVRRRSSSHLVPTVYGMTVRRCSKRNLR